MTDERRSDESEEAAAPREPAELMEDDPKVFVLTRELAEVHLLLDNLSSDPDTTITALAAREPPAGLEDAWIDRICEISWPPTAAPDKAKQAALLIRAKDYLNRLAKPASGASIAFTLLVTQREDDPDPRQDRRPGFNSNETHSRASLAELAFPDFAPRAQRFRKALRLMNAVLLAVLVLTCFTSWYVAFGNSTLGEYAVAQKRLADAQVRVANLEVGVRPAALGGAETTGQMPQTTQSSQGAQATQTSNNTPVAAQRQAPDPDAGLGYCNRWKPEPGRTKEPIRRYGSAEQRQACLELEDAQKQRTAVEARLTEWLWLWGWLVDRSSGAAAIAAHFATIIGTAALPVLYGVLGAGAAVLRSISHRIKASTLSPRDFSLSLQQLALGAVIGACIGLFIVQPGEEQALIGPVALSISAISFIAGFGVEAVFQALEALISRIFNVAPAATTRAEPRGR